MIQSPTELPYLKNEAIWQYDTNVQVKQTLQIVHNICTGVLIQAYISTL